MRNFDSITVGMESHLLIKEDSKTLVEVIRRLIRLMNLCPQAGRSVVDATVGGKLTIFPKADYNSLF